jgi:hypothetical protein
MSSGSLESTVKFSVKDMKKVLATKNFIFRDLEMYIFKCKDKIKVFDYVIACPDVSYVHKLLTAYYAFNRDQTIALGLICGKASLDYINFSAIENGEIYKKETKKIINFLLKMGNFTNMTTEQIELCKKQKSYPFIRVVPFNEARSVRYINNIIDEALGRSSLPSYESLTVLKKMNDGYFLALFRAKAILIGGGSKIQKIEQEKNIKYIVMASKY